MTKFLDADMDFKSDLVLQKGLEYLNKNKVFFPVCFNFVEPSHQLGYFRHSGYGLNFVKKEMLNDYEWVEYDTHGKEDNDFWNYFNNKNMCEREEVESYFHQWHSENIEFKIKYWKNNKIENQKNRSILDQTKTIKNVVNKEKKIVKQQINNLKKKYVVTNKISNEKNEKIKNLINFLPNLEYRETIEKLNKDKVLSITNIKINNIRYNDFNELVLKLHNLTNN